MPQASENAGRTGNGKPAGRSTLRNLERGVWFILVILVMGCLYYARDFFVPLFLALLVYFTLAGPVRFLSTQGVPPAISASVFMATLIGSVLAGGVLLSDNVIDALSAAPDLLASVKTKLAELGRPLESALDIAHSIENFGETRPPSVPQEVVVGQPGLLTLAAGSATRFVATFAVSAILVLFLLASGDMFLQKLVRISPNLSDKKRAVQIVKDIQFEVSRYLWTITMINAAVGVIVMAVMYQLGMPEPLLLGLAAAALNFIPYAGALLMMLILAFVGFATAPTLMAASLPPLVYLAIHLTESGLISPLILGQRLRLNAVAVFTSIAFWGWMWGLTGALIAVPLLVIVKIFSDHVGGLAVMGEFLSDESEAADAANSRQANGEAAKERARPAQPDLSLMGAPPQIGLAQEASPGQARG